MFYFCICSGGSQRDRFRSWVGCVRRKLLLKDLWQYPITKISMHSLCEHMYNCILFGRPKHCEILKMCRNTGSLYWQPPRYETQTCNLSSVPCDVYWWTEFFLDHWLAFFFFFFFFKLHSTEFFEIELTELCCFHNSQSMMSQWCLNSDPLPHKRRIKYVFVHELRDIWHFKKENNAVFLFRIEKLDWNLTPYKFAEGLVILVNASQLWRDNFVRIKMILFAVPFVGNRGYQIKQSGPFNRKIFTQQHW